MTRDCPLSQDERPISYKLNELKNERRSHTFLYISHIYSLLCITTVVWSVFNESFFGKRLSRLLLVPDVLCLTFYRKTINIFSRLLVGHIMQNILLADTLAKGRISSRIRYIIRYCILIYNKLAFGRLFWAYGIRSYSF